MSSSTETCMCCSLPDDKFEEAARLAYEENPANGINGTAPGGTESLAIVTGKMWAPNRVLTVKLNGGSEIVRQKVVSYVSKWSTLCSISFNFIESGDADIRVGFLAGQGSWSYVGTDCLSIAKTDNTMNFGWLNDNTAEAEFERVIVHEFGHALGCIHEHQSPASGILWDKPKCYAYFAASGWSKEQVDRNVFEKYSANSCKFSFFDDRSIMMYAFPASLTTNGYSSPWNSTMSTCDQLFATLNYGSPSDIFVFHQGYNASGDMWLSRFGGGTTWGPEMQVPNLQMSDSPSAVRFNGKVFVFHQGYGASGEMWYTTSAGLQDTRIGDLGMTDSPSAVVFNNTLYVFHQGYNASGALWYTKTSDGVNWAGDTEIGDLGMSDSPSAVVFNGKLYVFHQGYNASGALWYTRSSDGVNWEGDTMIGDLGMSCSPSAVVFNNTLYVFHQGYNASGALWYTKTSDGVNWAGDTEIGDLGMTSSPSAVVANGYIYVFHQGYNASGALWYTRSSDGVNWEGDTMVNNLGMSASPCAVALF